MSTPSPQETPPDRDEQAAIWCMALAAGELSAGQARAFDQWLAEADNAAALHEAIRIWNGSELLADMAKVIPLRNAALRRYRRADARRMWRGRPGWPALGALAAILLIALASFALLHQPVHVYSSGVGERRVAVLDDGSRLSLDADSRVDVRMTDSRRDLMLVRGRAKFDVARDPLRPFSVAIDDKAVVATGTSFSVERLQKSAYVLLYEGHVAVVNREDRKPVRQRKGNRTLAIAADLTLAPGEQLVVPLDIRDATATVSGFDPTQSLYWETGQLSFENQPLALAVERVNRHSSVKIGIGDSATGRITVNGVFDANDAEAFVEAVTALNDVVVTRGRGTITLHSASGQVQRHAMPTS